MRADPRNACANEQQRLGWAVLHDLVAHPLLALTGWCGRALRFHDWTSHQAWPSRAPPARPSLSVIVDSARFGILNVTSVEQPGFYSVLHGRFSHAVVVKAAGVGDAVAQAEVWFSSLVDQIPHSAAPVEDARIARGRWRP